jgi:hypothetical protein
VRSTQRASLYGQLQMIAPVRTAKPLSKPVRKSGVQIVYTSFYSTFTESELLMIQGNHNTASIKR